jgi:ribonuclease P/MRP protein subunit POP1
MGKMAGGDDDRGTKRKAATQSAKNQNGSSNPGGRDAKRVKTHSRAPPFRTQTTKSAFGDGFSLEDFAKAQEFAIRAMEENMRESKAAHASRAFQSVPREMRRRTASHNVKRVPKRLRARAAREMATDNTPTVDSKTKRPRSTRARLRLATAGKLILLAAKRKRNQELKAPKPGLDKRPLKAPGENPLAERVDHEPRAAKVPKSKFKKRQRTKLWLPTHEWHAKRARITPPEFLWGFALPLTSNNKSYRPTHHASRGAGVVCWDTSYFSTIKLTGDLMGMMVDMGIPRPRSGRFNTSRYELVPGTRTSNSLLLQGHGPTLVIFNYPSVSDEDLESGADASSRFEVFIRVHPASFPNVWKTLLSHKANKGYDISLQDLRQEVGSIELKGPAATEVLQCVLQPYLAEEGEQDDHAARFRNLGRELLAVGTVLAFSVQDPRLQWPPNRYTGPEIDLNDDEAVFKHLERFAQRTVPASIKPIALFDKALRERGNKLPSQGSLNRRRGTGLPGQALTVGPNDPPVPVLLMAGEDASWTLVAPRGTILPLWQALMHCPLSTGGNPRFGGLDELRQVTFEHGHPWFPADFPTTIEGQEWEWMERSKREKEWDRRPRGKRTAFESLDLGAGRKGEIGDPFACDWTHLLRISGHLPPAPKSSTSDGPVTPRKGSETVADATGGSPPRPPIKWFDNSRLLVNPAADMGLMTRETHAPIATVSVTMLNRGDPRPCARIYRLPPDIRPGASTEPDAEVCATEPTSASLPKLPANLRQQWLAVAHPKRRTTRSTTEPISRDSRARASALADELLNARSPYPPPDANADEISGHPLVPDEADLIGFVTTGGFNLAQGRGAAVGHLLASAAREAVVAAGGASDGRLCVVRNVGESIGWVARWDVLRR